MVLSVQGERLKKPWDCPSAVNNSARWPSSFERFMNSSPIGEAVGGPEEDQRRRAVLSQMQRRRKCSSQRLVVPDPLHQLGYALEAEHRVEQDQGIGFRRDTRIFTLSVQSRSERRASSNMATGRTSSAHDSSGIDAQLSGVGPDPANRTFRIFDAFSRTDSMPRFHSVVSPHSDHTAPRQMVGLGFNCSSLPLVQPPPKKNTMAGR